MTDDQKAAAYYKAGILKESPPFVPARVLVLREQFGDFPFPGAGVAAGEHECQCNKWGAVSVTDRDGKQLGLRLNEFEPVAWRENIPPNERISPASKRSGAGLTKQRIPDEKQVDEVRKNHQTLKHEPEPRICDACGHKGSDDDASTTEAHCGSCGATVAMPKDDLCPECGDTNCMLQACPECGGRYSLDEDDETPN